MTKIGNVRCSRCGLPPEAHRVHLGGYRVCQDEARAGVFVLMHWRDRARTRRTFLRRLESAA